ncbi:hypothetical protein M9458_036034, partial [Cirrhinus mrigala]
MAGRYGVLEKQDLWTELCLRDRCNLLTLPATANTGSVSHPPKSQCPAMPAVGEQDSRAEMIPSPINSY